MIPFKNSDLKFSSKRPKHIIIHDTAELAADITQDEDPFQIPTVQKKIYNFNKDHRLGYHLIIDRFKSDYYPTVCQPLFTDCVWEDMDPIYHSGIHVAFLGNYDYDMLMDRAYKVLAFQILVPLSRYFRIPWENIVLHKEISNDKTVNCPGEFFDRVRMQEYFRTYYKRGPSIVKI